VVKIATFAKPETVITNGLHGHSRYYKQKLTQTNFVCLFK
jgi:hypothetical protein